MVDTKDVTVLQDTMIDETASNGARSARKQHRTKKVMIATKSSLMINNQQDQDRSDEKPTASIMMTSTPHKRQKRVQPSSKPRQRYSKKWDPVLVVTDSKSPLTKCHLLNLLRSENTWTSLSPAQQRELLHCLPGTPSTTLRELESAMVEGAAESEALPNIAVMRLDASMAFKADVRQFQEELRSGKLDIGGIEDAMRASARRRSGEFDEWKVRERENQWSMHDVTAEEGITTEQAVDVAHKSEGSPREPESMSELQRI